MTIENLSRPGQPPQDGDRVMRDDGNARAYGVWPLDRAPLPVATHYEFATEYLTAAENDAWLELVERARAAVAAGTATQTQKDQLRAFKHFELAGGVNFETVETQIAFLAMHQWGVLTQERAGALGRGEKIT